MHTFLVQVTLEEQMICGALQTLNEEAFEDVASSERPSPSGLPTGEMLAAASQLQLAPICETSEFGSPGDEQKIHNLLQYNNNNNNNGNNNNNSSGSQQQKYLNNDYNRSASSHSLQSLNAGAAGGMQMSQGNGSGSTVDLINVGGGVYGGYSGGGGGNSSNTHYGQHHGARLTRPNSIADELLIDPMSPSYSTASTTMVPTVVVVPNSDSVYDDTKL